VLTDAKPESTFVYNQQGKTTRLEGVSIMTYEEWYADNEMSGWTEAEYMIGFKAWNAGFEEAKRLTLNLNERRGGRLMKALADVLPKQEPNKWTGPMRLTPFQQSPIRAHAEQFAAWMPELPTDHEEMKAALWVFGERIAGDMEKRMNHALKIADEAINLQGSPSLVILDHDYHAHDNDPDKATWNSIKPGARKP
jgi:hypothetical protein